MAASVKKVSLALGNEELEWARKRAKRVGKSLSQVMTEAARAALEEEARKARQKAAWRAFVEEATGGTGVDAKAVEAAGRELDALWRD